MPVDEEKECQERITAWRQFGETILNSDEVLEGEPERFRFRPYGGSYPSASPGTYGMIPISNA